MDAFGRSDPPPSPVAGWYPDPSDSGSYRYWDGTRWTDAVSSAIPPAGPNIKRDDTRTWALAAHLSALLSLFIGFPFVGPLVVYLVKRDDPFVRRHAAEALNFNLSVFLYLVVGGIVTFVLHLLHRRLVPAAAVSRRRDPLARLHLPRRGEGRRGPGVPLSADDPLRALTGRCHRDRAART